MLENFKWINEGEINIDGNKIIMKAPTGQGGNRIYENLSIESRTVKNIRAGEIGRASCRERV